MKLVKILAIDTSCDDTAGAVLENDRLLSSVVSSQIDVHKKWGGVVPRLARREHEKMIDGCIKQALEEANISSLNELDALAVTYGPGLAPALEVGVNKIKELAKEYNLPVVAVNHMEGHTLSTFLKNTDGTPIAGIEKMTFPFMAVCVSGGHTEIILAEELGRYTLIGQTVDDAAGEAFDKVARMLDLGYPGGPAISKQAEHGSPTAYDLPRPMKASDDYNFSFSGLKTACLYMTNDLKKELEDDFSKVIPEFCASFQEAVVDSLLIKVKKAVKHYHPNFVVFGGGVSANKRLREKAHDALENLDTPVYFPPLAFCTDNAAMIGLAGYYKFLRGETVQDIDTLDRDPSITIETG